MEEIKKSSDESWKDAVQKEKEGLKKAGKFIPPTADFSFFVTTLALQASIALGSIPNPTTQKTEEDTVQAQFLIDTLGMLKDKTAGNLNPEEGKLIENILYELRSVYISKTKEVKL